MPRSIGGRQRRLRRWFPIAVCVCATVGGAAALRGDDSAKLFQDSVRPLLERKCFECHSAKAEEVKGNLRLETLESILKGGDQGPAIVAGDPENSFLVKSLKYEVEDFQMPPNGRLPDAEIALVEKWIKSLGPGGRDRGPGKP